MTIAESLEKRNAGTKKSWAEAQALAPILGINVRNSRTAAYTLRKAGLADLVSAILAGEESSKTKALEVLRQMLPEEVFGRKRKRAKKVRGPRVASKAKREPHGNNGTESAGLEQDRFDAKEIHDAFDFILRIGSASRAVSLITRAKSLMREVAK